MSNPKTLIGPDSLQIYYSGPNLTAGKLPALFYFALSGEHSLSLDPFNQPAIFLSHLPLRVFSLTIPGHEKEFGYRAMDYWASQMASGNHLIEKFIAQCRKGLDFLIQEGYADGDHIAAAGLSRGAFIAAHFTAQEDKITTMLGFSPLTSLSLLSEFKEIPSPMIEELSLMNLTERLCDKKIRCYIGNHDTLVGTDACYSWIRSLTESAYIHKHRSPPIELVLFPSIGHKGHGTPPEIFRQGAEWVAKSLGTYTPHD